MLEPLEATAKVQKRVCRHSTVPWKSRFGRQASSREQKVEKGRKASQGEGQARECY